MLLLLPTLAWADPAVRAERLATGFVEALAAGDAEAARSLCSPAFRERRGKSCEALVDEVMRGGISLAVGEAVTVDGGGVVRLDASWSGEPVSIWLRAEKVGRHWLLVDGQDDDEEDRLGGVPRPAPSASAFATALLAAVAGGPDAMAALCTPSFAASGECGSLAEQVARKGLGVEVAQERAEGGRRVVTLDVLDRGHRVDRVYAYADGERLDGLDELDAHVSYFLAGDLPGTVDTDALPEHPGLAGLGEALLAPSPAADPPWTNTNGEYWRVRVDGLALGRTWWLERAGAGAVCFNGGGSHAVVARRVPGPSAGGDRWELVDYAYDPGGCRVSLRDLLGSP